MEKTWFHDDPHACFWRRLLNQRVDELVNSRTWLRSLRYKNEEVKWWMKKCGHIFEERGLNLYELIAQSHDEGSWDLGEYDEAAYKAEWCPKKVALATVKQEKPRQDAVSLDHPCKIGIRSQEEEKSSLQVRASDERCESELQKGGIKVV